MKNLSKNLSHVHYDSNLLQTKKNTQSRFVLLIGFKSEINSVFGPHHNMMTGLASNSLVIAPGTKPHSNLSIMVLDTQIKEVVFFDKLSTSNYDPRVETELSHITKTILKSIYYK